MDEAQPLARTKGFHWRSHRSLHRCTRFQGYVWKQRFFGQPPTATPWLLSRVPPILSCRPKQHNFPGPSSTTGRITALSRSMDAARVLVATAFRLRAFTDKIFSVRNA